MAGMIHFMQLMDLLIRAVRPILRWCWRSALFVLGFLATTMAAYGGAFLTAVGILAQNWCQRALDGGFPTIWDRRLYYICWCFALAVMLVGWVVLSYLTITVIRWIF